MEIILHDVPRHCACTCTKVVLKFDENQVTGSMTNPAYRSCSAMTKYVLLQTLHMQRTATLESGTILMIVMLQNARRRVLW